MTSSGLLFSWEKTPLALTVTQLSHPIQISSKHAITLNNFNSSSEVRLTAKYLIIGNGLLKFNFFQAHAKKVYASRNALLNVTRGLVFETSKIIFNGSVDAPPDSFFHIKSKKFIWINSERLPQQIELEAPDKVIVRLPKRLTLLTTRALEGERSELTLGPDVKTRVDQWLSVGESLVSSGKLVAKSVELRSPQAVSLVQLNTKKFKIVQGQGDVFIAHLSLSEEAQLEVRQYKIFVVNLQAPEGLIRGSR